MDETHNRQHRATHINPDLPKAQSDIARGCRRQGLYVGWLQGEYASSLPSYNVSVRNSYFCSIFEIFTLLNTKLDLEHW